MTTTFDNHLPRHVVTGRGASATLPEHCGAHGWRRVFLVSDAGVAAAGLVERVAAPLEAAGILVGVHADVPPEPPAGAVDLLAARIAAAEADAVVGLGGGSVMDATKVAAVCVRQDRTAASCFGIRTIGRRGLPTILVPTTAGTGSEATFVAILTDTTRDVKVGVVDPCLLADIAVVDPALTDTLPRQVTASAGMDALVHAIEAFIARVATPLARGLALEAARRIGRSLETVCDAPHDRAARDDMAVGSHLAGLAFANSSCCAVHALALPLGGRFHQPHGVITGSFVGEVMRHNLPACGPDLATIAAALGWAPDGAALCDRLDALAARIGLFEPLGRPPVPDDAVDTLAAEAVAIRRLVDPNPRPLEVADAARIYRTVLARAGRA